MNPFLNSVGQKNVSLVKILISENRYFSLEELSNELNITGKTVKKIAFLLLLDVQKGIYQAEMSIRPRMGIQLISVSDFFLFEFERFQLEGSIEYKLVNQNFYGEFEQVTNFSEKNFISVSSSYKALNKIKGILDAFNVGVLVSKRGQFLGIEKEYRYFFFYFYWNAFKGERWPFKNCNRKVVLEDVGKLEKILNRVYSIPEKEMMCYWLAIMWNRLSMGFKLSTMEKEDGLSFKETNVYDILKEQIDSIATINQFELDEKEKEKELNFLCLILCGIANYETKIGNRMSLNELYQLNGELVQKWILFFIEELEKMFNLSLTCVEREAIEFQLLKAHYCWEQFNSGDQFFKSYGEEKNRPIKDRLLAIFLKGQALNLIPTDLMHDQGSQRYYEFLVFELVSSRIRRKIGVTICLVTSFDEIKEKKKCMEIAEYVGNIIQFTDQVSGSTDIVLTDFNYIELAEEVPKYVVFRIPSVEKEFILLKDTVDRIVYEKMGLIV